MWIYIVSLILYTEVSVPCPNGLATCLVGHTQRIESVVQREEYCDRTVAFAEYRRKDDELFDSRIYSYKIYYNSVKIDSVFKEKKP